MGNRKIIIPLFLSALLTGCQFSPEISQKKAASSTGTTTPLLTQRQEDENAQKADPGGFRIFAAHSTVTPNQKITLQAINGEPPYILSSDNEDVATVDNELVVTAQNTEGTVSIEAEDGRGRKYKIKMTVKSDVKAKTKEMTVKKGAPVTLSIKGGILPYLVSVAASSKNSLPAEIESATFEKNPANPEESILSFIADTLGDYSLQVKDAKNKVVSYRVVVKNSVPLSVSQLNIIYQLKANAIILPIQGGRPPYTLKITSGPGGFIKRNEKVMVGSEVQYNYDSTSKAPDFYVFLSDTIGETIISVKDADGESLNFPVKSEESALVRGCTQKTTVNFLGRFQKGVISEIKGVGEVCAFAVPATFNTNTKIFEFDVSKLACPTGWLEKRDEKYGIYTITSAQTGYMLDEDTHLPVDELSSNFHSDWKTTQYSYEQKAYHQRRSSNIFGNHFKDPFTIGPIIQSIACTLE